MITVEYPTRNNRWGRNELSFATWQEYWKTLGYLSNPNVHRENIQGANIDIVYERNSQSDSYTDTTRIYYYGNECRFSREFPSLYAIKTNPASGSSATFRINRKEFGETLINDLGFIITPRVGRRDAIILPPRQEVILARISTHDDFDRYAWDEGYSMGSL